jgi:hypothetical protein
MGNVSSDHEEEDEHIHRKKIHINKQSRQNNQQQQQVQYVQQKNIQKQQLQQQYQQQYGQYVQQNQRIIPQQVQYAQQINYPQQNQRINPQQQQQVQYAQQINYPQQNQRINPQQQQQVQYAQQINYHQQHQQINYPMQQQQQYVQNVQRVNVAAQQHAFPQFPNRVHKPSDEMVKQFHGNANQNQIQNQNQNNQLQIMSYPSNSSFMYDDRALDVMIERPLPNIDFNKSNFNDRIQEYETNYNKEEEEFEKYEQIRKSKFKSYMSKKREKLQEEIRKFESTYNPYEILGLENGDHDISNIRKAYKKMALKYHPDKVGDQYTEQFQIITQSYIYLLKKAEDAQNQNQNQNQYYESKESQQISTPSYDLASKIAERSIIDDPKKIQNNGSGRGRKKLKETRITDYVNIKGEDKDNIRSDIIDVNQKNFDIQQFNKLFEKYRVEDDETKEGYGDLLKHGLDDEDGETSQIFNKNMNKEIFNAHFDQIKSKKSAHQKSDPMIPDAFDSSSRISCAQIGQTTNFSNSGKYTDLKQAYFEDNVLIDPGKVQSRKDYRNLQELENERSRLSYDMDPQTKRLYDDYEMSERMKEEQRVNYLKNRDDELRSHHNYVSRKLFVNGKKVE